MKRSDCLLRVKSFLPALNEAEKKVAQYLLDNAEAVLNMTITQVAASSAVSETTVFRFCRSIDYRGFQDFRIALARDLVEPRRQPIDLVKRTDEASAIASKVAHNTIESIQDSLRVLNYDEIESAYRAIKAAKSLLVIGVSTSGMTAEFAANKFADFGLNAQAETDVQFQAMRAAQLGPKDVFLGFSRSGNARDIIEATLIAKEQGAVTIGVTNKMHSYFAKTVDILLSVISKDTRFRDDLLASRTEHLVVVDILYTMLAVRNPKRAAKHKKKLWDSVLGKQF